MKALCRITVSLLLGMYSLNANAQGASVFADLVYWNASEQTNAVWTNAIGFPITNKTTTYGAPNIQYNWNAGFRGGIAYDFPRFWDTKLYWTHLPTSANSSYVAASNEIMTPEFFSGFLSGDAFTSADINWKIFYNTLDFEISHTMNLTNSLAIWPTLGIKGATINQSINSDWHATLLGIPVFTANEYLQNNYSGIGPSFGIGGKWNAYGGFSLLGNFSTALLWGTWNIQDTYSRPNSIYGLHPAATITTSMREAKLGTAVFQYFLGAQWAYHSIYDVNILLGYEAQYWPNQLRIPTFQLLPLHGDLTLQGVTCGISIGL